MNFLAHAYLSGKDENILTGNFIGDFIKGKKALDKFSPEIVKGIELHRIIDAFTDNHAVVAESKNRLRPRYRHYSGVIVDVFYDHFLAAQWEHYHTDSLPDFAQRTYATLQSKHSILPTGLQYVLPYMVRGNWLVHYASVNGIHRALSGMAQRTPFRSRMEEASEDLTRHYDAFRTEFNTFFPELRQHTKDWLSENIS